MSAYPHAEDLSAIAVHVVLSERSLSAAHRTAGRVLTLVRHYSPARLVEVERAVTSARVALLVETEDLMTDQMLAAVEHEREHRVLEVA